MIRSAARSYLISVRGMGSSGMDFELKAETEVGMIHRAALGHPDHHDALCSIDTRLYRLHAHTSTRFTGRRRNMRLVASRCTGLEVASRVQRTSSPIALARGKFH